MRMSLKALPWWAELAVQVGAVAAVIFVQAVLERKVNASHYEDYESQKGKK